MIRRAGTARVSGKVERSATRTPVFRREKTQATSVTFVKANFTSEREKYQEAKFDKDSAINLVKMSKPSQITFFIFIYLIEQMKQSGSMSGAYQPPFHFTGKCLQISVTA